MNQQYSAILDARQRLPAATDPNYGVQHTKLLEATATLLRNVNHEGIFSSNEELDDIATSSLKYLSLWYFYGDLVQSPKVDLQNDRVVGRMALLHRSIRAFLNFFGQLLDYKLLSRPIEEFYRKIKGFSQFDLTAIGETRETKIQMYRYTKAMEQKWVEHKPKLTINDEEIQREAYVAKLEYEAAQSWQNIVNDVQELQLLSGVANISPEDALKEGKLPNTMDTLADIKKKDLSTRVEVEPGMIDGPPVQRGKVVKPFTLTRTKAEAQVMGTGQVLPSMSVEEFVSQELKNGGMVQPEKAKAEEEDDEDNPDFQDAETARLRRWDEFTDANPKGSGNTMNLG